MDIHTNIPAIHFIDRDHKQQSDSYKKTQSLFGNLIVRQKLFYSPLHFLPSAPPKRTPSGAACSETTLDAPSVSTSTASSPTHLHHRRFRRHSQPPPPPARAPNCIAQPKTPAEAANHVGNTFFFFFFSLVIFGLVFDILWVNLRRLKRKEYVELEFI